MRCEEIMKKSPSCLGANDSVLAAAKLMSAENIGFVPVCDDAKHVLGTVTDRDLAIRVLAQGKAPATRVSEVMSREVIACKPGDDLRQAENLLARHKKSRILCIDDAGALAGVISLSDLAQRDDAAQVGRLLKKVTERETTAQH